MKISLPQLHEMKLAGTPIVMVTAYDHPSGRIVDQAGVDMVLVGDSAANTVLGHDAVSTVGATMDELLVLTRAVARACTRPLVIGDLPFMSYQVSDEDAVRNGGRFIKEAGADAVKLECVPEPVAAAITRRLTIPTIGIGSGAACDGQVLVLHDLLDMRPDSDFMPKFVKQFAHVGPAMRDGVAAYANEVRARSYPGPEHTYKIDPDQLSAFEIAVEAGAGGDNVLADW